MAYKAANGKERQDIAREASLAISMALEAIPGVNPAVTFLVATEPASVQCRSMEIRFRIGPVGLGSKQLAVRLWRKLCGMQLLNSPRPVKSENVDRSD